MLTFDQKTAINKRFQDLYDEGMRIGKHGHYETMFSAMHQAYAEVLAQSGRSSAEPVKAQAQCATEGCERPATCEFSRKGVGSYYCPECFGKVLEVVEQSAIPPVGRQEAAPIAGAGEELVQRFERQVRVALQYAADEKPKHEKFIASVFELQVGHLRDIGRELVASLSQLNSRIGELERENTELREKWGDYPTLSARLYDREKAREAEQETCRAAIARAKSAEAKLAEAREVIEPFAAYIKARDLDDADIPDPTSVISYATSFRGPVVAVTFGDFRRARSFHTSKESGAGK